MEYDEELIKVEDLTLKRINSGEFQKEFPELYELQRMSEHNAWYSKGSVFNHTMNAAFLLEQIEKKLPVAVIQYLDEKIDDNTNRDILHIASYFKDIGKSYTLIKSKHGTRFPEFDKVGAEFSILILDRIFMSDLEKKIITNLIANQNSLVNIVHLKNQYLEKHYNNLEKDKSEIIIELNLLSLADTLNSANLKIKNPDEYHFRIDFYKNNLMQF